MQISREVIHREIAGEHFLVPVGELALKRSGVFVITEIGAEIWEMLQSGKKLDEILGALLNEYEVAEDVLKTDIEEFLQMLRKKELIRD
ncbi:MAG: PqqD family protein [Clostridia bacterium]|nr:PqqD family protein [Clostridia bacterium]